MCRKQCGKSYARPDTAPLPKNTVQDLLPFTVTGVDFTSTLYIHDHDKEVKVYICLLTCANTRAVHLEVVSDLSTDTFILAFRRFASRKSLPQVMISDNASTYAAAAEEFSTLLKSEELETTLWSHGVVWKFIPKKAPMVWRFLGTHDWTDEELLKESARQITCFITSPPNLVWRRHPFAKVRVC